MSDKNENQAAEEASAAAAAAKSAEQAEAKRLKAEQKAAEKAQKDAEKKAAKEAKAAEKEQAKQAAAQKKLDDAAAKEQAKKDAVAAKEATRMPEANGVRRPKPDTLCGKAWKIFDDISAQNGAPASIAQSLEAAKAQGLNEGNVRAEYARWRKFFGVSGRVAAPSTAAPEATVDGGQA